MVGVVGRMGVVVGVVERLDMGIVTVDEAVLKEEDVVEVMIGVVVVDSVVVVVGVVGTTRRF